MLHTQMTGIINLMYTLSRREGSMKKKLNIGGHPYEILTSKLEHEDRNKELYGRHLVKENVILINEDIAPSRIEETLIHEVLHAIFYNTGLEHNERQIEAISNGLYQLGVGDYLWKKSQRK
jgi:hypothetical protein